MSNGSTNTATLQVNAPAPAVIASASLTLDSNSITAGQGDTATVQLFDSGGNVIPTLPSNASITYTSTDPSIASVLANGNSDNPLKTTITTATKTGSVGIAASWTQN